MSISGNIIVIDSKLGNISIPNSALGIGQNVTKTVKYLITQADIDTGFVTNSAYAIANNIASNTVTTTITAVQQHPALTITKTASPTTYTDGQSVTYTYTVNNTGNVALTDVLVIDSQLGTIPLLNKNLAPGTQTTGTATYQTTQSDYDFGSVTNTATVYNGTQQLNQTTATVTAIKQQPALTITKTASPTTYNSVGQNIAYTYAVTNSGNVNISGNIIVIDSKLGNISIPNSALGIGQNVTKTVNYLITQADINTGFVTNSAYAIANNIASNTVTTTVNATHKSIPTINWNNPADISYGTPLSSTQLDASA